MSEPFNIDVFFTSSLARGKRQLSLRTVNTSKGIFLIPVYQKLVNDEFDEQATPGIYIYTWDAKILVPGNYTNILPKYESGKSNNGKIVTGSKNVEATGVQVTGAPKAYLMKFLVTVTYVVNIDVPLISNTCGGCNLKIESSHHNESFTGTPLVTINSTQYNEGDTLTYFVSTTNGCNVNGRIVLIS
jgi:hypothetical protein